MPIFDQGYQHWNGQLAGPAARTLAITRRGVRSGMKGLILRLYLIAAWLPALALVAILCLWGMLERNSPLVSPFRPFLAFLFGGDVMKAPLKYRVDVWTLCYHYFLLLELYVSLVLILMVGPTLISQDLRFNALPLYFSRPLRRIDYLLGKLGIIGVFLAMVIVVPSVIAYALGLLFSLDFSIVRDTLPIVLSAVAYGLVITLSAGSLVLALSSLSRNSRYIGLFWIGIWVGGLLLAGILGEANREERVHAYHEKLSAQTNAHARRGTTTPGQDREAQRAWAMAWEEFEAAEFEATRNDWRPLVSYTANLSRIGQQILGTDACWRSLAALRPPRERQAFLATYAGPQYPWYWSAGVLAGFFVLSACVLNFRVKSLDRLK